LLVNASKMSEFYHRYLDDVLSRYDFELNYQVMDEILVVWVYAVASDDDELKHRIISFFQLQNDQDLKEFVQEQDLKKYHSLCTKNSNRCLRFFAKRGDWRNVKIAIRQGANDWDLAMSGAARGGHFDLVKFFIEKGARDLNLAMSGAAKGGHFDLVKFFIEKGARDLNLAMREAAVGGHFDLVKFFIEKGANNWNWAMSGAARGGHFDLVKFFIEKGARDLNLAVGAAKRNGYPEIAEYLESLN